MKHFTIILAFMLFATLYTKATVLTVSNDANQPAQYSNLQTACDSASVRDTIYVQGTSIIYGDIHINKQLHIIGAGIKPAGNYLYGYPSIIRYIYIDTINYISGASGTVIEGMSIGSITHFTGAKNIIYKRNRFYNYSTLNFNNITNLLLYNNIFELYYSITNSTNVIIMNNIHLSTITGGSNTTIISNNIFLNNVAFTVCQSTTISNNIFYYGSIGSTDYCSFSNNITFAISDVIGSGTNTAANNIAADPKFTYIYSTTNHSYNDQNKYSTQSSSPAINAGTDATDIGIYGGQYPWPISVLTDYIHCIPPTIPQVQELIIQNSSVPANGTLNFSVKAYKTSK